MDICVICLMVDDGGAAVGGADVVGEAVVGEAGLLISSAGEDGGVVFISESTVEGGVAGGRLVIVLVAQLDV